ncbi:MAG: hypothetical protein AAGD25_24265 [Cyanobacteria bacterium P01_F01_bin.150]
MTNVTVKEKVISAIEQLPDSATFEDVMEHIYFLQKIEAGLQQVAAGETFSHKEAVAQMKTWHK